MAYRQNTGIEKNAVEARQGSRRPKLVYVLGAGLVLVIVAFAVVWVYTAR